MRIVRVAVTKDLLSNWLTQGSKFQHIEVEQGVPKDAELVRVAQDNYSNCVYFFFTHPSFLDIPEGTEIPFLTVHLLRTRCEEQMEIEFDIRKPQNPCSLPPGEAKEPQIDLWPVRRSE